jgi:glyoxylase-like metal-dependent hydrolase (beta-lactamase superfamily II)
VAERRRRGDRARGDRGLGLHGLPPRDREAREPAHPAARGRGAGGGGPPDGLTAAPHFRLEQVADGAWAAIALPDRGAVGNAGLVDLGGETLVFDTFFTPLAARGLLDEARRLGLPPVSVVVNSHWHGDHVRGNQVFEGAPIVATRATRELIAGRGQERLAGLQQELQTSADAPVELVAAVAEIEQRLPDDLFDERRSLGRAELITYGGGHTASDAFLHLADAGVLFAADLALVRSHGWIGDGVPEAWPGIVDRIGEVDFDVLVPGHGEVGGRGDLEAFRAYLDDLLAAGEHGPDPPMPERYRDWNFAEGWSRNLTALAGRA